MTRKVCILKRRFGAYGGLEKYTYRIAQAFAERDCEVHILSSDRGKPGLFSPKIHLHTFDVESLFGYRTLDLFDKACAQWLKRNPMDIVFGMDRNRYQTHLRAGNGVHAEFLKLRSISDPAWKRWSYAVNPLHRLILRIEKQGFENPNLNTLFTNSQLVKNQILENYRVAPEKVHVVHNGVEWHEFKTPFSSWLEAKAKVAGNIKIDPTSFQFLFIGNGYKRKGLIPLLKGLARLSTSDFHLSVVGKESNIAPYKALARSLGLERRVTFFGPQKQITPFYQLADAVVIPSEYDPFANVTVEALAMGVFVVSSPYNGGKEILNERNGAIIETIYDPDAMHAALEKALQNPKTWIRSQNIRNEVEYLDFSNQLNAIVAPCIEK